MACVVNKKLQDLIFIEVTGFSMWPFIKQGEKLIIKIIPISDLRIGDIILYRADNQLVCHRLIKRARNKDGYLLYTRGDSSTSLPVAITGEMFLGKAIGIIRNNNTINLTTKRQQFINYFIILITPCISWGIKIGKVFLGKQ